MWAGIISFIGALPRIIDLISRFSDFLKRQNINQWLDDVEATIDKLEKAETTQQKIDSGKSLIDLLARLK